jgi:putative ABC transport system substrate-binding protein
LVPTANTIALLVNPDNSNAEAQSREIEAAARTVGLQLRVLQASKERDFDTTFAGLAQLRIGGLVIGTDGFFVSQSRHMGSLTARYAVPAIFQNRQFVSAGGLMSYGGSDMDAFRLMGLYASRILKGERPGDLPVQQSTKAELILNLKTAKALGLTVPLPLLGRADEVFE